jgi:hypothetical protein
MLTKHKAGAGRERILPGFGGVERLGSGPSDGPRLETVALGRVRAGAGVGWGAAQDRLTRPGRGGSTILQRRLLLGISYCVF